MANHHHRVVKLNLVAIAVLALCAASSLCAQALNVPTPADATTGSARAVVGMPNTSTAITNAGIAIENLSTQISNVGATSSAPASGIGTYPWISVPLTGGVIGFQCSSGVLFAPFPVSNYAASLSTVSASTIRAAQIDLYNAGSYCGPSPWDTTATPSAPVVIYAAAVTSQGGVLAKKYVNGVETPLTVSWPNGDYGPAAEIKDNSLPGNNSKYIGMVFPLYGGAGPTTLAFDFQSFFTSASSLFIRLESYSRQSGGTYNRMGSAFKTFKLQTSAGSMCSTTANVNTYTTPAYARGSLSGCATGSAEDGTPFNSASTSNGSVRWTTPAMVKW